MKTDYPNTQCFEIKQSTLRLLLKILLLEICIVLLHLLVQNITRLPEVHQQFMEHSSWGIFELAFFHLLNTAGIFILFVRWHTTQYFITPKEILIFRGIFSKKTSRYDIRGIQSAEVSQSLVGRLFNYGTLQVENPLLKTNVTLKNIAKPQFYISALERYRQKALQEMPLTNVIPQPKNA
ncbi:MAG: PH domain-containing protein [Candidatus Gracilibacteria bacterium]|nr:PH domain-containing protein [Candidatus Gracilibacteria bacterium]